MYRLRTRFMNGTSIALDTALVDGHFNSSKNSFKRESRSTERQKRVVFDRGSGKIAR